MIGIRFLGPAAENSNLRAERPCRPAFESFYRLSEKANWPRTPVSGATVSDNDVLCQPSDKALSCQLGAVCEAGIDISSGLE